MRKQQAETAADDATSEAERARRSVVLREGGLVLGFLIVVIAAVVTVALPELSDAPDEEDAGNPSASTEPPAGVPEPNAPEPNAPEPNAPEPNAP